MCLQSPPLLPFLLLWFASGNAQLCGSSREFAVDNCTDCLKVDHSRGHIQMAECQDRTAGTACVCLDYPNAGLTPPLVYYPRIDGNNRTCATSWSTAPGLFSTLVFVTACAQLYAATHMLYIVVRRGMFLPSHRANRFTKNNVSALFYCIHQLCWLSLNLWTVAAQAEGDIGTTWFGYHFVYVSNIVAFDVGAALFYTSICDMV